ncbi:hypothetical protein [Thermogutta sp.]|uniref:hypothetical protein n=1 Tax=Thermogutta sp. TaxID=1962930 RepID=UPI00321F9BBD
MATKEDATRKKESIFARLDKLNEFERRPVTPDKLQSGRYFAGLYAGEHVAATEFVIGALFVIWGARTFDVVVGLLLGNVLAVLSWTLVCAPIAVQTRLTLYWYFRQIGGPVLTVIYNLLNAVLYCILAGCMITVAASAVRIPFGIPPQTGWLPQDPLFVVVVIGVGAVVVTLAILGFKRLSQFAVVCSPWMLLMFVCGALMTLPSVGHVSNWKTLWNVAEERIWSGPGPSVAVVRREGSQIVLELENVKGRLQVLKEATGVGAAAETDPTQVPLPGFFLASTASPEPKDFVAAEARLECIYGKLEEQPASDGDTKEGLQKIRETDSLSGQYGDASAVSAVTAAATSIAEQPTDGASAEQAQPQRGGRSQGGANGQRAGGGSGGFMPPVAPVVEVPPKPPILGYRIRVESKSVPQPAAVKYVMPKSRGGVVCNENFVPLQSFQAAINSQHLSARSPIGFWHIVFFAWICNLAMHLGLSDMAIFRYAKSAWYGLYSAFGMFLGHYLAWICAGIMGAAAARAFMQPLMQLDSGQVAYFSLGWAGALAVIIAGWTTANPTLYRAGLALQVITPNWPRWLVTFLAGTITTAIACFPFVFLYLLDFVGIYGILLLPVGTIVVVEHWLFPILGWQKFWSNQRGQLLNLAALIAWAVGLGLALVLWKMQWLHLFFLVVPVWLATAITYIILAALMGASKRQEASGQSEPLPSEPESAVPGTIEAPTPAASSAEPAKKGIGESRFLMAIFGLAALLCLVASLTFAWFVFAGYMSADKVKPTLLYLALAYFVTGVLYLNYRERLQTARQPG